MIDQDIPQPAHVAAAAARKKFQLAGELLAGWAPGRINLIGEHTDYNDGWVLPVAIERVVALAGKVAVAPDDRIVRLYSVHHREKASFSLAQPLTAASLQNVPLWARYIAGAIGEVRDAGLPVCGFTAAIAGDVPLGGGMSSSAALIIAALTWLDAAFQLNQRPLDLARLGQRAEIRGSGVRVGILDHAASVLGRPGQAVLIDCRSLSYSYVPFHLPDVGLLICETGIERSLASSAYNERRTQCEAAVTTMARVLHAEGETRAITALRDITERDFLRLAGHIAEPARRRARHVINENIRTLNAATALASGDPIAFGQLVLASHASLRDDYAVSIPELDAVVEIATQVTDTLGARLVGAGFGGGALIVAPIDALPVITAALMTHYPQRCGRQPMIHRVAAAGGPGAALLAAAK